ncbi:TIR domain-containing protein [Azospirillum melinis]|uniref:TIR domain-containing protein n=1 Tax=Azospirillum melinis TaxID=328839 RepID=A0ABX2KHM6_9PROT|nr:toll/interleukin-1 receptor domain-containing protein [Azospirillum melinis]MBP2303761.1 hypothetical protein [Azospirillum melinis]NUB00764.1 TIR domain-containing protein [Azospirillum melinis]
MLYELDILQTRLSSFFFGHYLRFGNDFQVSYGNLKGENTQILAKTHISVIIDIKHGHKFYAMAISDFGQHWKFFADIGIRQFSKEVDANIHLEWGYTRLDWEDNITDAPFTKSVYVFTDELTVPKQEIIQGFKLRGLTVRIFDNKRWNTMSNNKLPEAFISHDSRDKEDLVRPLVSSLNLMGVKIWYDEFSLEVGDSLSGQIDKGLRSCNYAIVVVSKNFLSNKKWASSELDALLNRYAYGGGTKFILPVWHNVEQHDVAERSPILSNIVAVNSSMGIDKLADRLFTAIRGEKLI